MAGAREEMIAELKRVVVPVLRELGLKGTFPHFRRVTGRQVELLTFEFSAYGGLFVVEVGKFPPEGVELGGETIPAEKVRLRHLLRRVRLGPGTEDEEHWFDFERNEPATVAESIVPWVRGQAVEYWKKAVRRRA